MDALREWWLAILTTLGTVVGLATYVARAEARIEARVKSLEDETPRLERWLLRVEAKIDRLLEERRDA